MKNMKKKGFTLIELLAVIMILAIVALVSTPIVLDVIDEARQEAEKETVYGIIQAGKNYYAESILDNDKKAVIDGKTDIYSDLVLNGEKPENGSLYVNSEGRVSTVVVMDERCYRKSFDGELEVLSKDDENCDAGTIMNDTTPPVVSLNIVGEMGNNGWYKSEVYVEVVATDSESGIKNYKWCTTLEDSCELTNVETELKQIEINNGYKLCAMATDKKDNDSDVVCTDVLSIDTVAPLFEGLIDLTIEKDAVIDLEEGITVSDSLSGIEPYNYDYSPKTIDTSKTGSNQIIYVAVDNAGNIREVTRNIIVSADAPTITFTPQDNAINGLGWAKDDFYVNINVKDNTGHGIKEFRVCTITGNDMCDPDNGAIIENQTSAIRDIVVESNNNRICVKAIDNSEQEQNATVKCSDAYKLDKTAPVIGSVNLVGDLGLDNWYASDVTINTKDGTDELSGHLSTTVNIDSINDSTDGTNIILTTQDVAGNVVTDEFVVKVDKTLPIISIEESPITGKNGWYVNDAKVTATVSDTYSQSDKLKWCEGLDCTPTEELAENTKSVTISDTKGTQLCVIAYDKAGNEAAKKCSNVIKVDKVAPQFSGISDITVNKDTPVDLVSGVSVSDSISEIDGTYTYSPTSIDVTKTGVTTVTYKVYDKAGNEKIITRKVVVSADAPTITFTPTASAKGWANSDYYVTINVKDNSGHGIKEFRICTATTDTCDPTNGAVITGSTSAQREITIESNNNRICVYAIDNSEQVIPHSEKCSDAYKLDKTKPNVGTINIAGTEGENGWYTSDVTITKTDGTDGLSGHLSTTIDKASLTASGSVIVTTKDNAQNITTKEYAIKIDKTKPTCSFGTLNYIGKDKTATIDLTCTNAISGIKDTSLSTSDFSVNNSNVSITSVAKISVTNGYKYTITLKGVNAGSSTITLPSGKISTVAGLSNSALSTSAITVSSLSVSPSNQIGHVGGSNLTATISGSNYGTLTCSSSNNSIATCTISGTTLTVKPGSTAGSATITVTGTNGSITAAYTATIKATSVALSPTSGTGYVGGSNLTSTISGSNYGTLTCSSSNNSVATCSISGTTLTVKPVAEGTATITVKEANGNKTATYTATIKATSVALSLTSGTGYPGGSNLTSTISGSNYGTLTCSSSNNSVATCSISGTTLTVKPVAVGTATITVKEANGNKTVTYSVTVKTVTLALSPTSGTAFIGGSNLTATVSGSNYGTLTCTSSNTSVATCTVSGTTLTIKPASIGGTATITLKEANLNKTATYSVTVQSNVVTGVQVNCSNYSTFAGVHCPSNQTIYVLEDVKTCLDTGKNNPVSTNSSDVSTCVNSCYNSSNYNCTSCYGSYNVTTYEECRDHEDCNYCYNSCGSAASSAYNSCQTTCTHKVSFNNCVTNTKIFGITFDNQGATTAGSAYVDAVYGKAMLSITKPTRTGYTFGGYYTEPNGGGTQYYDSNGNGTKLYDRTSAVTLYAKWTANNYTITLNNQGATSAGTTSTVVTYDSSMSSISVPTKNGYYFLGYYTGTNGTGNRYFNETGAGLLTYKVADNMTLYAYWIADIVSVTCSNYATNGTTYVDTTCINGTANVTGKNKYCLDYAKANYSSVSYSQITTCMNSCYNSSNYNCSTCGDDQSCYSSCSSAASAAYSACETKCKHLYQYDKCKTEQKTYKVTLNNQSATSAGTKVALATYQGVLPTITVPTRTGYTFGGYYSGTNGSGTQYYNASGVSVKNYDKTTDTTLYAKWTANKYTITLNNQSATTSGSASVTATYDSVIPGITLPTKTGYTFYGYYTGTNGSGTRYYDENGNTTITWKSTSNITLYAYWISNSLSITCSNYSTNGTTYVATTCISGSATVTGKTKYCLDYAKANYSSASYSQITTCMNSCYNSSNYNCSTCGSDSACYSSCSSAASAAYSACETKCKHLYQYDTCKAEQKIYNITLDNQSATSAGTKVTEGAYGLALPNITIPTRTGYTFGGYYTGTNGSGTQYYNASGVGVRNYDKTTTLTLYAKWTANKYTITLNNQSATSAGSTSTTATYDSVIPSITIPSKTGYKFMGYYTGTNGSGTKYYTETGTSTVTWKSTSNITLYAYWISNSTSVTCSNYDSYSSISWAGVSCSSGSATVNAVSKYCLDYAKSNYSQATYSQISSCMSSCYNSSNYNCSSCTNSDCYNSCSSAASAAYSACETKCKKQVTYNTCTSSIN